MEIEEEAIKNVYTCDMCVQWASKAVLWILAAENEGLEFKLFIIKLKVQSWH